jgi:hypothetical protein
VRRRNQKKMKAKSLNQEGKLHVWPRGSDSHHRDPRKSSRGHSRTVLSMGETR